MNCIVEECDRDIEIKNVQMCKMHYTRMRTHGTTDLPYKPSVCSIEWCDRKHASKGYCSLHYQRMLDGVDMDMEPRLHRRDCSVDGCGGVHAAKGMCRVHYERKRAGRDMNGSPRGRRKKPVTNCLALECDKDATAAGYCNGHYQQVYRGKELAPLQVQSSSRPVVDGYKECAECLQNLPVSDYYSRPKGNRPLYSKCKTCTIALQSLRKWERGVAGYPYQYQAHLTSLGRLN